MNGSGQSALTDGNCWPFCMARPHVRYRRVLATLPEHVLPQAGTPVFSTCSRHIGRAASGRSNRRTDPACADQKLTGIASVN